MNTFKKIDINLAISKINNHNAIVVDIRDKESFNRSHINGAINLSNQNINNLW